jgi:hypothetical protein
MKDSKIRVLYGHLEILHGRLAPVTTVRNLPARMVEETWLPAWPIVILSLCIGAGVDCRWFGRNA